MKTSDRPKRPAVAVTIRYDVTPADRQTVRAIVQSTGFFSPAEIDVAVELVDERLAKGLSSGYHFVFAETKRTQEKSTVPFLPRDTLGFACYGQIPATAASFDLYWIVTHKAHQGAGIGRTLLAESERLIQTGGGGRVYVDTSSRPQYASTRAFYERNGYQCAAVLDDFYAPGDGKVIFFKVLDERVNG